MTNYILGFDVSKWQDDPTTKDVHINYDKAVKAGARFVYIRASYGLNTDRDYQLNRVNSRMVNGLHRGFYHFLTWDTPGKAQADYFWGLVKSDTGDMPLVVDFESNPGVVTPDNAKDILRDFLVELETLAGGHKIMIYTGGYFAKENLRFDSWFTRYPLWLASYSSEIVMRANLALTPWQNATIWQYTAKGNGALFGVESKSVDLDYFIGTEDELNELCGSSNDIPDIPPESLAGQLNELSTALHELVDALNAELVDFKSRLDKFKAELDELKKS